MNKINTFLVITLLSAVSFSTITPLVPSQKEESEAKNDLSLKFVKAIGVAAVGGYIVNRSQLSGTSLGLGLGLSTALAAFMPFMDKTNARAALSLAVGAPIVAQVGAWLSSDQLLSKTGLLSTVQFAGIGELVKNATAGQKTALAALVLIGTYRATQSHLDRFTNWTADKFSEGYENVASRL